MITAYDVCIYGSSIYLSAAAYIFAAALDLFDAVSDVNQQLCTRITCPAWCLSTEGGPVQRRPGTLGSATFGWRSEWVQRTKEMYANILMKPLQGAQFVYERDCLTGWPKAWEKKKKIVLCLFSLVTIMFCFLCHSYAPMLLIQPTSILGMCWSFIVWWTVSCRM